MAITDIRLQHFRSYHDSSFELDGKVNIIVGPNASGKTNLLEAILMIAGATSWRAKTSETISFNKPWARLDAHTNTGQRTLKIIREPNSKTYEIDNVNYKRLAINKRLPVCLFEPNHLLILSGRPELRRDYLDDLAEQIYPEFGLARRQYQRALAQRNSLLKQGRVSAKAQIFSWNIRLAELAGQLVASRLSLLAQINSKISDLYQALASSRDKISVNYASPLNTSHYETSLLKNLEGNIDEELARGFTLAGPHRDDLQVIINNKGVSTSASRGEARTLTLALKILEAQTLEASSGSSPLLLLDDVFSELDGARRQKLTKYLSNYQTFITTTDADVVIQHFTTSANIIPLQN